MQRDNPRAYRTDVLAEFADVEESLYPSAVLDAAMRPDKGMAARPGADYVAAIDPATRGNAWTLVVATREGGLTHVAAAHEWVGSPSDPLSPRAVLAAMARILREYGLDWCYTDQWSADAIRDLGGDVGLHLVVDAWTHERRTKAYLGLAAQLADGRVTLPAVPALRKDLTLVSRRTTQTGVAVVLPRSADGRHCDFAPAAARVVAHYLEDVEEPQPEVGTDEYWQRWEEDTIAQELEEMAEREKQKEREGLW